MSNNNKYCWNCRQLKDNVDQTKGNYYSGICLDCRTKQEKQLKEANAELIIKNGEPQYIAWYAAEVVMQAAYIRHGAETYFITALCTCDELYSTYKSFVNVQQFIDNNFKHLLMWGNMDTLKKHDFWFHIEKVKQFYQFGGNCNDISNSFTLRTLDINQIWEYIDIWTKVPKDLKEFVKDNLDKGFVFASNPEPHEDNKILCLKDYSDYDKTQQAKILKLSDFGFAWEQASKAEAL